MKYFLGLPIFMISVLFVCAPTHIAAVHLAEQHDSTNQTQGVFDGDGYFKVTTETSADSIHNNVMNDNVIDDDVIDDLIRDIVMDDMYGNLPVDAEESVDTAYELYEQTANQDEALFDVALFDALEKEIKDAPAPKRSVLIAVSLSYLKNFFENSRQQTKKVLDLITEKSKQLNAQLGQSVHFDIGRALYHVTKECMIAFLLSNNGSQAAQDVLDNHTFTVENFSKVLGFAQVLHLKLAECKSGE